MEYLKLIGIVIIVLGFALKFDVLATVLLAGLVTGIVAGISMIFVLLGATGLIAYLPVPMLTAIVISSLLGATEFDLAVRLRKISKKECLIYWGAFWGVLMLGTINGVLIGIILSFAEMIIRTAKPARCFLGVQPGHRHFEDLTESLHN